MNAHNTAVTGSRFNPLPSLRSGLARLFDAIAQSSNVMACSREAERLMALSDAELAARGLTRDRVIHHAFARYMGY